MRDIFVCIWDKQDEETSWDWLYVSLFSLFKNKFRYLSKTSLKIITTERETLLMVSGRIDTWITKEEDTLLTWRGKVIVFWKVPLKETGYCSLTYTCYDKRLYNKREMVYLSHRIFLWRRSMTWGLTFPCPWSRHWLRIRNLDLHLCSLRNEQNY